MVMLLLDKGTDVNARGGRYGNALYAASARGHEQVVKLLLDKGADANAQSGRYGNALYAASARGDEHVVKLLLDKGADVNAQIGILRQRTLRGFRRRPRGGDEAVARQGRPLQR
jgi:ankyrin repeat protein